MSNLRDRLTFANIVSLIALFVALGGTSYAVFKLPKNSVGSKQIKTNAVTTAKIKNEAVIAAKVKKGTLTGDQINASTLGTVPSAENAQTAQIAQTAKAIPSAEPWHEVGSSGEPPFQSGCKPVRPVRFYKDQVGVVHLDGAFHECSIVGGVAFQLPLGFRPGQLHHFPVLGSSEQEIQVFGTEGGPETQGALKCDRTLCTIDGITFRAES